jgi:hypothetical protein
MAENPIFITEGSPAATSVGVDVIERASPEITTTTTADPGSGGTSLAVTLRDLFPQTANFKIRVENEIMLVTAGQGTGPGSFTVTRGIDGTGPGVAHTSGSLVSQMVGVQRVEPIFAAKQTKYLGRVCSFRTPGRAGTVGQKIFALHNASGSAVVVDVQKIFVDLVQTVGKSSSVLPPVIRAIRFTSVPTNGTSLTKQPEDSSLSSNSSVTVWGDASVDGTGSGTTLTITLTAGASQAVSQEFAPRLITGAGYEMFDRTTFFENEEEAITLRAAEGLAVFLDYTAATQNPVTDMWVIGARWVEWTQA